VKERKGREEVGEILGKLQEMNRQTLAGRTVIPRAPKAER
jgi:hypothetical protein